MRSFFGAILLAAFGGAAAAALVELAPLPVLRVAATLALAVCVFFAGRAGAPGWPVLGHLVGLAFAAIALAANWAFWLLAASDYDAAAAIEAVGSTPAAFFERLENLSETQAYTVGGRTIGGALLIGSWSVQALLLAAAGFFGGQSAFVLWRSRRRAQAL